MCINRISYLFRLALTLAVCAFVHWLTVGSVIAADDPKVSTPNDSVKGDTKDVMGLNVTTIKLRANVLGCMFWADKDATAFWALDGAGKIFRISFPEFKVTQKIELGKTCSWLAPSAEGLVVSVSEVKEIWVLDPATFAVKKAIKVPNLERAASGTSLSTAFAGITGFEQIYQVDLKSGTVAKLANGWWPVVTPDSKYLLFGDFNNMLRYGFRDGKAVLEQTGPRVAGNGPRGGIQVSVDSQFAAITCYGGNEPTHAINIYPVENIERPELMLQPGRAGVYKVAFDPAVGKFYMEGLLAFTKEGKLEKEYKLEAGAVHQMLMYPKGGKLLVLGADKFLLVELPQK